MKTIRKIIKSYRLVVKHIPELKAEYDDLHGITKMVVRDLIEIWD